MSFLGDYYISRLERRAIVIFVISSFNYVTTKVTVSIQLQVTRYISATALDIFKKYSKLIILICSYVSFSS